MIKPLLHKFQRWPECFHLQYSPDVGLDDDAVRRTVLLTSRCRWDTPLTRRAMKVKGGGMPLRITDCTCDRTGAGPPDNPKHLAYQKACLQLLKAFISEFRKLVQTNGLRNEEDICHVFLNVVDSSLLQHCRLDKELLSLCHSFFDSAKNCGALTGFATGSIPRSLGDLSLERKFLQWMTASTNSPPF